MSNAAPSTVVGVAAAVVAGLGAAAQTRVNGSLAVHVGSGFGAAVISFGSGLVVLTVALACWSAARRAVRQVAGALRAGRLRWWEALGGAAGGCYVAAQGLTVATLGVALFMVAVVAGQSTSSLLVDRAGLAPGGVRLVTLGRALGPALAVVAVAVAVSGSLGRVEGLWLAVVPAVAGALQAWQQAVNGRVRAAAGHAPATGPGRAPSDAPAGASTAFAGVAAATFGNFLVGTVVLVVAFGVSVAVAGRPPGSLPTDLPADLVLWSGGILGIVFIAIQAAVVHRIGVLLLGLGMIAGQISGALALDLLTPGVPPPGPATYAGAALTLVAVAIPVVETRLRRRP
ncbi:transporter family-2 protein [Isoptericola jiangsuensis]|uniref:Transporter family-2 protein n=1 Tax=Isoptericola jiangsuensis TaxID=548579 RepID=A0A2A9F0Q1_9MICO|nr:DMT family transporter [Isoptericola jiangsuensis]PFG44738.1 transporter family-2 protein [Isoptericola jiangsuensis]